METIATGPSIFHHEIGPVVAGLEMEWNGGMENGTSTVLQPFQVSMS